MEPIWSALFLSFKCSYLHGSDLWWINSKIPTYEINPPSTRRITEITFQKPLFLVQASWKRVNSSESWDRFFLHHINFSYLRIWESTREPKLILCANLSWFFSSWFAYFFFVNYHYNIHYSYYITACDSEQIKLICLFSHCTVKNGVLLIEACLHQSTWTATDRRHAKSFLWSLVAGACPWRPVSRDVWYENN
jgi:hypothetical protein